MTENRKTGLKISKNENIELFQTLPGKITVKLKTDFGEYWILARDTYHVDTPNSSKIETDPNIYKVIYKELENEIESTRHMLNITNSRAEPKNGYLIKPDYK